MKPSMKQMIEKLTSRESLVRTYKEMFDGITTAEAEMLADSFQYMMTDSKYAAAFKENLAATKQKYKERQLYGFPEIDFDAGDVDFSISEEDFAPLEAELDGLSWDLDP